MNIFCLHPDYKSRTTDAKQSCWNKIRRQREAYHPFSKGFYPRHEIRPDRQGPGKYRTNP
ncbi:hypothetical protein DWY69_11940 [Eisenbergiella massiliensis]|uniref:Uncharacterized protein n=1 Tax=Eisenbergiella massiliensis TaxID=1720294 RepID=A0A3E3IY02_9FIRM|nr:hypothetical protein DWY69_11940 [Eisenbergiella massiliensis]